LQRFLGGETVLVYKRLEQGRFAWPAIREGVMRLSRAQFEALFDGLEWQRVHGPRRVRRPTAAE
jgi:transposase